MSKEQAINIYKMAWVFMKQWEELEEDADEVKSSSVWGSWHAIKVFMRENDLWDGWEFYKAGREGSAA